MADRIRVFLALNLSSGTRKNLDRIVAGFPDRGVVKWVGYEKYHLTMKFIGPLEPARLDPLFDAVSRSVTTCRIPSCWVPRFFVQGLGLFSRRGIPSVVWAGVKKSRGALKEIHEVLEANLGPVGFQRDKRSFSPHVTLGRIRTKPRNDISRNRISGSRNAESKVPGSWISEIKAFLSEYEDHLFGEEAIEGISVMESQLGPSGVRYHELERFLIPG